MLPPPKLLVVSLIKILWPPVKTIYSIDFFVVGRPTESVVCWDYMSAVTHRVEAALMDFIQDNNTVLRQHWISQDLPQQTAVRHVLHHCVLVQKHTQLSTARRFWFMRERRRGSFSPVTCSHRSAPGSPPVYPECTASPRPPSGPQWWQPPCEAEWWRSSHLCRSLQTHTHVAVKQ